MLHEHHKHFQEHAEHVKKHKEHIKNEFDVDVEEAKLLKHRKEY